MKTVDYDLPASWATALFYDDTSGMEYPEERAFHRWCMRNTMAAPLAASDEPFFSHWHDAREVLPVAAECLTYTFPAPQNA